MLLLVLAPLLVAACIFPKGTDGFKVWVTNHSPTIVYMAFTGESSLGDVEDPSTVTYRVDPATTDGPGPFINVGDPGEGTVVVMDEACVPIHEWVVGPGSFGVTIEESGEASIHEYGLGQRPTTQSELPSSTTCVET